jgi:hypothetical protein
MTVTPATTAPPPEWVRPTPSRPDPLEPSGAFARQLDSALVPGGPTGGGAPNSVGRIVAKAASGLPGLPGLPRSIDSAEVVARAHRHIGVQVPESAAAQRGLGAPVASLADARPGDVLVLEGPDQMGIYLGDGRMVSVIEPGQGPSVTPVDRAAVHGIRRFVTDAPMSMSTSGAAVPTPSFLRPTAGSVPSAGSVRDAAAPFATLFGSAGRNHGLDPALLTAVASVESGFDPAAISSAGARGLMQFMPATAGSLGVDPLDPGQAIDGAARYLRQLLDQFGSLDLALAGYNAGPGAVSRAGGIPPYAETRSYVNKVLDTYEVLR